MTANKLLARNNCRGLRDFNWGGPVKIISASTGRVKRVIKDPLGYDEIIGDPANVKRKYHKKAER